MAKRKKSVVDTIERGPLGGLINVVVWIVGVLVGLAVGFGMIDNILSVRYIPMIVTQVAGWIVVILVLLSVLLKIIDSVSN